MGVSIMGKIKENNHGGGRLLNRRKTEADLDTVPRRRDLAFLMYTDTQVAEVNLEEVRDVLEININNIDVLFVVGELISSHIYM